VAANAKRQARPVIRHHVIRHNAVPAILCITCPSPQHVE